MVKAILLKNLFYLYSILILFFWLDRSESVLIEGIANDILKKLNDLFPSDNKDQLVGVESIIKEIESLLLTRSTEFNNVGIWGIGGIGKTTIAKDIYSNISSHFEGSYFMQNIREESEKPASGLAGFRRELLSTLLDDGNVKIDIPNIGLNFERRRLSQMKVLIVFDNVTCLQQIEFLIGRLDRLDYFMPASRIIITTRDAQLLKNLPGSRVVMYLRLRNYHTMILLRFSVEMRLGKTVLLQVIWSCQIWW